MALNEEMIHQGQAGIGGLARASAGVALRLAGHVRRLAAADGVVVVVSGGNSGDRGCGDLEMIIEQVTIRRDIRMIF